MNNETERLCRRIDAHLVDFGTGWLGDDEMEAIRDHMRALQGKLNDAVNVIADNIELTQESDARIAELERELEGAQWDRDAAQTSAEHISKIQKDVSRLYHELLYQVGIKYPDESRHETALRYLRNAEKPQDNSAKSEALPND